MEFETVIYTLDGAVATVTMNRPEALNALSLEMTLDLGASKRQAIAHGGPSGVVAIVFSLNVILSPFRLQSFS